MGCAVLKNFRSPGHILHQLKYHVRERNEIQPARKVLLSGARLLQAHCTARGHWGPGASLPVRTRAPDVPMPSVKPCSRSRMMFSCRSRDNAAVSRRKNARSTAGGSSPVTILTATRVSPFRSSAAWYRTDPPPIPIGSGSRTYLSLRICGESVGMRLGKGCGRAGNGGPPSYNGAFLKLLPAPGVSRMLPTVAAGGAWRGTDYSAILLPP